MSAQEFVFASGLWLGEGKISFRASSEYLKFYTKWNIKEEKPGMMVATQVVEIHGVDEPVINLYTFDEIQQSSFKVILENNLIGRFSGKGLREEKVIAWEFRGQESFEGFEVYERQENGDYFFHAEYGAPEQFRSMIEGLIWQKQSIPASS